MLGSRNSGQGSPADSKPLSTQDSCQARPSAGIEVLPCDGHGGDPEGKPGPFIAMADPKIKKQTMPTLVKRAQTLTLWSRDSRRKAAQCFQFGPGRAPWPRDATLCAHAGGIRCSATHRCCRTALRFAARDRNNPRGPQWMRVKRVGRLWKGEAPTLGEAMPRYT